MLKFLESLAVFIVVWVTSFGGKISATQAEITMNSNSSNPLNSMNDVFNSELLALIDLHQKTDRILIPYSIFIIFVGVLTNLVNFACFYRMKKRNAQNLYLGALSVAEIFNILINIAVPILSREIEKNQIPVKEHLANITYFLFKAESSDNFYLFFCVLNSYIVEVCLFVPVWIMVILALERFFSITWPLRKNILSTRKQAKRTLTILITIICVWCTFKFQTAGIEKYSTFKEWDSESCREITLPTVVNISTTFWAIVPEFLTLVLNLFIIHRIKITTYRNQKFYPTERTKKITQATRVVLFLSIIFILLISPTGIIIILDFIYRFRFDSNLEDKVNQTMMFMIARKYVLMLYETNMIISFPIYFFTIKNFKETVQGFVPSLSQLKRRDSARIGIKDESNSNKQKQHPHYQQQYHHHRALSKNDLIYKNNFQQKMSAHQDLSQHEPIVNHNNNKNNNSISNKSNNNTPQSKSNAFEASHNSNHHRSSLSFNNSNPSLNNNNKQPSKLMSSNTNNSSSSSGVCCNATGCRGVTISFQNFPTSMQKYGKYASDLNNVVVHTSDNSNSIELTTKSRNYSDNFGMAKKKISSPKITKNNSFLNLVNSKRNDKKKNKSSLVSSKFSSLFSNLNYENIRETDDDQVGFGANNNNSTNSFRKHYVKVNKNNKILNGIEVEGKAEVFNVN